MKAINKVIILTFLLSVSCEEIHQDSEPIEGKSGFILHAGDTASDAVSYYKFDPSLIIRGNRNGNENKYFYLDSIQLDLNNNGQHDLYFEFYMYYEEQECDTSFANDSVVIDCFPEADAFCSIKTFDNIEVALEQTDYLGILPKKFAMGDIIDSKQNWLALSSKHRVSYPASRVNWDTDEYNNYMGFRIITSNDTVYGWIRLNTHYSSLIEIYDYVIEK